MKEDCATQKVSEVVRKNPCYFCGKQIRTPEHKFSAKLEFFREWGKEDHYPWLCKTAPEKSTN